MAVEEHIILVAFEVEAPDRRTAVERVEYQLGTAAQTIRNGGKYSRVTAWWTAEDDRQDRSDRDSAVFVRKGHQGEATVLLHHEALTDEWNVVER